MQAFADTAGAPVGAPPGSPRHRVLPPPATEPLAPEQEVAVDEPGLVDVVLCDHKHTMILLNHFTKATAQGNAHAMELLAAALAIDIRLHAQAVHDVLCPLLARRYGVEGASMAAVLQEQLQAVERHVLEMLTFRLERDWAALAKRANLTHQDFAGHVHEVEVRVLPRLAADMSREELVSAGLLFQQQKQTASLAPDTGDEAFAAAGRLGPASASVLGDPLIAGQYQQHSHRHGEGAGTAAAGAVAGAGGIGRPHAGMHFLASQEQQPQLPVARPDKVVTASQRVLMGEEL